MLHHTGFQKKVKSWEWRQWPKIRMLASDNLVKKSLSRCWFLAVYFIVRLHNSHMCYMLYMYQLLNFKDITQFRSHPHNAREKNKRALKATQSLSSASTTSPSPLLPSFPTGSKKQGKILAWRRAGEIAPRTNQASQHSIEDIFWLPLPHFSHLRKVQPFQMIPPADWTREGHHSKMDQILYPRN